MKDKQTNDTTPMRRAARALLCLAAAPLLMGGKCDRSLVTDSGFDLWCGDALCAWKVDSGSVAKVPTWHERDYGVALLGDSAAISQLLPVSSDDVVCITFDLLAEIDGSANVVLALDFDDDGSDEHTEVLPRGDWTPVHYRIVPPTYFQSVRISIRKQGAGRAVLAQIAADSTSDCAGDPPIGRLDRPLGASCETTDQCGGGSLCLPRTSNGELFPDPTTTRMACGSCSSDSDCGTGAGCGLGWSPDFILPYRACAPAAAAVVGDRCLVDAECAGGVCCDGVCSTCCDRDAGPMCPTGASCLPRAPRDDGKPVRTDWHCAPGSGGDVTGVPCLSNDDCMSGRCLAGVASAPLSVCGADGRRCASNADCPRGSSGNPCIAIGVAGGICQ